jgi:hypothetical protein
VRERLEVDLRSVRGLQALLEPRHRIHSFTATCPYNQIDGREALAGAEVLDTSAATDLQVALALFERSACG